MNIEIKSTSPMKYQRVCPSNMLYSQDSDSARCAANGSDCVSVCCTNALYGDSQQ